MITIDAIEEYFRAQLTEYLSKETGSRHNAIIFKIADLDNYQFICAKTSKEFNKLLVKALENGDGLVYKERV